MAKINKTNNLVANPIRKSKLKTEIIIILLMLNSLVLLAMFVYPYFQTKISCRKQIYDTYGYKIPEKYKTTYYKSCTRMHSADEWTYLFNLSEDISEIKGDVRDLPDNVSEINENIEGLIFK